MARATSTAYLGSLPVGFRFTPTDDELVNYYLRQKMMGNDHLDSIIPEVNIYKFEPWDLPQKSKIKSDDMEWYFLCPRVLRYANREQAKRTTIAGYWKVTGNGRKVRGAGSNELIAKTNILVFHLGRFPNGIRTNWVMHEFLPSFDSPHQKDFVLCKLKKNIDKMPTVEDGESSPAVSSDLENQIRSHELVHFGSGHQNHPFSEEGESGHFPIHSRSGLQTPDENIGTPISEEGASDFENQKAIDEDHDTPTIEEGALDPPMDSDFPFIVSEEDYNLLRECLESFDGCDESDFSFNPELHSTSANMQE